MSREVKHFSLDRIDGTELRVIADAEWGVLPAVGIEEEVIRAYIRCGEWPHEWVTLFILQDFGPLVRQLESVAELPPGGEQALQRRPVVNVYDLADRAGCQVFVNWQAMMREGYWEEPAIIRALLAHEHAHPLAECDTTAASRKLRLEFADNLGAVLAAPPGREADGGRIDELRRVLGSVARKLCLESPREVLANGLAIRCGFGESLLYLDKRNASNAEESLAGREQVKDELAREAREGEITPECGRALLLIGDLQAYLELAIETASFIREGRDSDAHEIETVLTDRVLGRLTPGVDQAYAALRDHYTALDAEMSPPRLADWCLGAARILTRALAAEGVEVQYQVRLD
jgi:hypothetical protein